MIHYLAELCDSILLFTAVVLILSLFGFLVTFFILAADDFDKDSDNYATLHKILRYCVITFLISFPIWLFVPTKNTIELISRTRQRKTPDIEEIIEKEIKKEMDKYKTEQQKNTTTSTFSWDWDDVEDEEESL